MPYIQAKRRPPINRGLDIALEHIVNPGDLNYAITKLCLDYVAKDRNRTYRRYNSVMGVLSCAAHEFYISQISPFEAEARKRNGSI